MIVFHWPRIIFRWPQIRSMKTILLMTWIVDLDSVKRCDGWLQTWIYQPGTIVSCPWIVSLVRVPELSGTIVMIQGHVQGHDSGTWSCPVPESCPWFLSLNFLAPLLWRLRDMSMDTIQGHDTIPGRQHNSCPWKFLKFQKRYVSFRDMFKGHDRNTIRDTIVSLSRVPEIPGTGIVSLSLKPGTRSSRHWAAFLKSMPGCLRQ